MRKVRNFLIGLVLAVFLLYATSSVWTTALGRALVRDDGPAKMDAAVVLAGDQRGDRILTAAELARKGYVPVVLVSGPGPRYGRWECDLAIEYAVAHGYSASLFARVPNHALSTDDEGRLMFPEMRRRGMKSFLLVTSDFHTARAARVFRRYSKGFTFRTIPAPDEFFTPEGWWRSREGVKTVWSEVQKSVAMTFGL